MREWNDIRAWRKTQREALVARRAALEREQRRQWNEQITELLWQRIPAHGRHGGRFLLAVQRRVRCAFRDPPLARAGRYGGIARSGGEGQPLQFRKWWPGAPMTPGVYDIPVPDGTDILMPDAAIVPMNGFDEKGYRLGYGGGYFDRTLAAFERRMLAIGVSFEALRLPTIYPQPHDVAMDFVVTEAGVHAGEGARLAALDADQSRAPRRGHTAERGVCRGALQRIARRTASAPRRAMPGSSRVIREKTGNRKVDGR